MNQTTELDVNHPNSQDDVLQKIKEFMEHLVKDILKEEFKLKVIPEELDASGKLPAIVELPPWYNHNPVSLTPKEREMLDDYIPDNLVMRQRFFDNGIISIRQAQGVVEKASQGIIAHLVNAHLLSGLAFEKMRKNWLETFDLIYLLNLGGNTRLVLRDVQGDDENLLGTMTGLAIVIFVKTKKQNQKQNDSKKEQNEILIRYTQFSGSKSSKLEKLSSKFSDVEWIQLRPSEPFYLLDLSSKVQFLEMSMQENGEHSLLNGLNAFLRFRQNHDYWLLKDSVISIHHGVELLMKQILHNEHPTLIFKDLVRLTSTDLKSFKENKIKESKVKTISFTEAITLIQAVIQNTNFDDLSKKLIHLNNYRNELVHYKTRAEVENVYELLVTIPDEFRNFLAPLGIELDTRIHECVQRINLPNQNVLQSPPRIASKEPTRDQGEVIFSSFSTGVRTNLDIWFYNYSYEHLIQNVKHLISVYDMALQKMVDKVLPIEEVWNLLSINSTKISPNSRFVNSLMHYKKIEFSEHKIIRLSYRPYCFQYLYSDEVFVKMKNHVLGVDRGQENRVIGISAQKDSSKFCVLMSDSVPDTNFVPNGYFLSFYTQNIDGKNRHENITDWALNQFRAMYSNSMLIHKWDIFYYTYALLHHPNYWESYAAKLAYGLPRIPFMRDFWGFVRAGQRLAEIHVQYESQPEYPLRQIANPKIPLNYRVEKMRLSRDGTRLIYNDSLTLEGIPPQVHEYKVGNRSALEWVISQYKISTNPQNDIINDPNDPADEMYILRLVKRVVSVSLETIEIISNLPAWEMFGE